MDQLPITGLEELEKHIQNILEAPEAPLNAKLFDEVELQLTDSNITPLVPRLLPKLTQILLTYDKDPTAIAGLVSKLLRPITFTQALTIASEDALIQALQSTAPSAANLAIAVIGKAARSPSDTAILSIMKEVVGHLLRTWLSTPHVGVGENATKALGDLLEVDCGQRPSTALDTQMSALQISAGMPPGQGLLWRRIFHDKELYDLIFSLCSPKTIGTAEGELDERQKSLAQARLLRLLPRLAVLDFTTITHTQFPDVEQKYGVPQPGLLYFATVDMVNKEEDLLMHITLVDSFGELLSFLSMAELSKPTLDYLKALVKKLASEDASLRQSLETTAANPETLPELVELLKKLAG